ncbi:MAG: POT family MFS transporter [Elusimicrobia bacterium]|nr:POT family MFS transporter [Elusimicrobiota bacterium]
MPTATPTAADPVAAQPRDDRYPPQIPFIIGNEACERFSYYGMRSILTVFMIQSLLMATADSKATYHLFVSACYLTPLLGGWISDRFWGKYKTILYLSLGYCIGHGILAVNESKTGLFAGLFFIALGAGGIKPCVSSYVGDQFTSQNKHLVKKVFDLFYWSINFGSFFSTMLIPWVYKHYGSGWAFGIPGILMAIALAIFWAGRKQYHNVPPTRETGSAGFLSVAWSAWRHRANRKAGEGFFRPALAEYKPQDVEGAEAAAAIFRVFATVSVFWALFDQHGSSWVVQAKQMELNVLGWQLEASQLSALNPLMVMGMIPIFTYGIYPAIERMGFPMTPLRRMSAGMAIAASSFVAAALIQIPLDNGNKISAAWQIIPYLLLTGSEIMVSITGLEFAYTQAPRAMKSTIMSFWFLTVFVGNLITAYVSKINVFTGAMEFWFYAGLMAFVSVIFIWEASRYKVREYYEEAPAH